MQVAIHSPWGEEQTIPHARPFCHPKQKGKSCLLKKSWKLLYVQHFILMRRRNLLLMKEEQKTLNCTRPTTFLQMKESNVWLTIWGGAVTLRIPTLDAQVCSFCVQLRLRRNKKNISTLPQASNGTTSSSSLLWERQVGRETPFMAYVYAAIGRLLMVKQNHLEKPSTRGLTLSTRKHLVLHLWRNLNSVIN